MSSENPVLTKHDEEQFLEKGYVRIRECFTREAAAHYSDHIWDRLGYRPDDSSTWAQPSIHMPPQQTIDVATFAPKAWQAACELIGGVERMSAADAYPWTDAFIVNLWRGADQPWQPASAASPGWHVDGSWFRHYLDSPEQGLLTIVLWSDVVHEGGATFVATDSIGPVARFLAAHPRGVVPRALPDDEAPVFPYADLLGECHDFIEATGEIGDVYLIHPMIVHTMSQNVLRRPRFITNSTLRLAEPMRFDRSSSQDYSLVERAVLRALGVDRLDFTATGPRGRVEPAMSKEHERAAVEERERMVAAARVKGR
jgi:hypothetical protein